MYTVDKEKQQGDLIYTVETREYHLKTQEGLEFTVRIEESWDWTNYFTDLTEDGTAVDTIRQVWDNEPLYDFLMNVDWDEE